LVGSEELLDWPSALDAERLWAVEDCRQLTGWLERQLLSVGEQLVRVPPKLTVPERRAGRTRGKSDPIDALAIARAALREPDLSRPRPDERVYREIKLLVDHRDDLVDRRRRTQQRLRWHLHALDPTFAVPLRMLGRATHLERVARWLGRRDQELQVRLARELVADCRLLNRTIAALDQELEQRAQPSHRHCSSCPAARLSPQPSCSPRSARSTASEATRNSRGTAASHRSKRAGAEPSDTASTAAVTDNSTPRFTGSRSPKPATTRPHATTSNANEQRATAAAKHSAASNDSSSASSTTHSKRAPP
jgi:transposase